MLNLSRRDFVASTALAAALGLNARLVTPAFAQKTPDPAKGFVSYKIGSAEVTALYDGIWEKAHDPAFIANASVEDVKNAMTSAGFTPDFVSIPFTVVVVKNGGKTILCDASTGGQVMPTAGKMMANMKAAGIDAGQDRHHPDLAFPSRSHLRPDGKGHQRAGVSERRNRGLGCRIQVLDRRERVRQAERGAQGIGEAHPGGVPDLEEHPSGLGRARGRARHPLRRCAGTHAGSSRLPSLVRRRASS